MALLETRELSAFYGDFQALYGITLAVEPGETIAIIGANGAGKTTFLKSVAGLIASPASAVFFEGRDIGVMPAFAIVGLGIALVPEGRRLFPSLTVEENLLLGAHARGRRAGFGHWRLETVYRLFPALEERRHTAATALSGGQQQMVAIGRGLMSNPKLLLCDEMSLGLAPVVIHDIYAALPDVKAQGTSLLIVEQDIKQALAIADRVYCFQEGRVTLQGRPRDLTHDAIHAAYFGLKQQAASA
jgi:branched-chain amino acid transport system ATP-binding protein